MVVALYTRSGVKRAGIYGHVNLRLLPATFVNDVVVRPSVEKGQIAFSCDVRSVEKFDAPRLQFEVVALEYPNKVVKRFTRRFQLSAVKRLDSNELSSQCRRVKCDFGWNDAHLWTFDDPFLYQVRARLLDANGKVVDETGQYRFGFREMVTKGSQLFLNGKPTHLRGLQIDLGWGTDRMLDWLKRADEMGMNCLEFSGPVRHGWYVDRPCRPYWFERILDYADQHGMIAATVLPGAKLLKENIFDPEVARFYQRRLDKHIRRYGNHPSIGMWWMHFNLACYRWYISPLHIDGSYKPTDKGWLRKERYCLEAERLYRQLDTRPLYHHACGNLGSIYTLNCYIGPTSPLQEREEWPLRWAQKRPFPLIACEHGVCLAPYWFRPRQFPLSVGYSDEPIFDEISAKYFGRQAYDWIASGLVDLYNMKKNRWNVRRQRLLVEHPGYQQVKSLVAKYSLRSWRTYDVTGIVFNSIINETRDAKGHDLPLFDALLRYFNDTDMYIAGPGDKWPSKDHCYYSEETVGKQIVLLNDLTRDLPCKLRWKLVDKDGHEYAQGQIDALAVAGQPTMLPIEFKVPLVKSRTELKLVVEQLDKLSSFLPESFALEIFSKRTRTKITGRLLLFDPIGDTTKVLARAGVLIEPLTIKSDLGKVDTVVVGCKAFSKEFVKLAKTLHLEEAVDSGLNLLVFEQTDGSPFELELKEQSARRVFLADHSHPVTKGLFDTDFVNLRGGSDLTDPYPPAPAGAEKNYPKRFFKWGNRGVVSTFVYTKPHYSPFKPVLECGFDLVDSPLLEARFGCGRVALCQVDVTSRYGVDPVSTRLVENLLANYGKRSNVPALQCVCVGKSAEQFVVSYGIRPVQGGLGGVKNNETLIIVGSEAVEDGVIRQIRLAVEQGARAVLLPNCQLTKAFGLRREVRPVCIGRMTSHRLTSGLNDGDLFFKRMVDVSTFVKSDDWKTVVSPGLLVSKSLGCGQVIACAVDPTSLGATRGRIKSLRFWNLLLANLNVARSDFLEFLKPKTKSYEANNWEPLPPYINW